MRAWCARFPTPIACMAMLLVANGRSIGSLTKRIFKAKAEGWSPLARNPEEWLGLYRSQTVLMERIRTIEIADPSI